VADRTSDLLNDHNQREIAEILKNLATASERLNQLLASTDATTKVISETAKTFGKTGEDIGSAATESKLQIKQSAAQIDQAFAAATLAAKRFDQLSMDVDRMVTSSEGQLTAGVGQLNQLLAQARSMVQKVSRLADDVQRQPTELLFGDRREGYVPK
jgi:phospholipid/cholesterol/gamma-HCH transport system substrate-binding protein